MSVNTGRVTGRRRLRFASPSEMLAEAERIAAAETIATLGNWTPAQIFVHLANVMQGSLDGFEMRAPWPIRLIGPLLRRRMLSKPMPSGFRLPPAAVRELVADESTAIDEALSALRQAVARLAAEPQRHPHPVFGRLSHQQWDQLHMRHAEMHMSFVVPREQ